MQCDALANDPLAWTRATAASLAEISSSARNRSATLYVPGDDADDVRRPSMRPACVAVTVAFGLSLGSMVMAVSTFSVLAGGYRPCGSLAASTWPVLAFAMTQAEAGTRGRGIAVPAPRPRRLTRAAGPRPRAGTARARGPGATAADRSGGPAHRGRPRRSPASRAGVRVAAFRWPAFPSRAPAPAAVVATRAAARWPVPALTAADRGSRCTATPLPRWLRGRRLSPVGLHRDPRSGTRSRPGGGLPPRFSSAAKLTKLSDEYATIQHCVHGRSPAIWRGSRPAAGAAAAVTLCS